MNIDPVTLAKSYQEMQNSYAFRLLMKKIGSLKTSSYKALREDEDPTARATLQVCDSLIGYLSNQIEFTKKEAERKLRDSNKK